MTWWVLLIEVVLVWFLWVVAVVLERDVSAEEDGLAEDQRRGVSIAPAMFFAVGSFGVAMLADLVVNPWGTLVVGGLHAVLGLALLWTILRSCLRLRNRSRQADH